MDMMARSAPPPGSANAGDLYVDLQSRTLWLGVDPAVDPAAFVLISDIVAFQAEVDGAVVEAKAYTDTRVATRALLSHTHTSSQITDFTAAVTAVSLAIPGANWVRGMIMMWSGSLAEIGVGSLAGWSLCDGGNSTPDLRDRFIIGAGNKVPGTKNTATSLDTTGGGTHVHSISDTAISIAQMPAHAHGGNTNTVSADHTHSGSTAGAGDHAHGIPGSQSDNGNPGNLAISDPGAYWGDFATRNAGWHAHSFTTGGISANHTHQVYTEGSSQPHGHTIVGGGGIHEHAISSNQLRETTPYYALAFIMKL